MKRRKRKKPDEEEEIISIDSSYLFEDEKLTIIERIKKLVGLLKDESDSEEDSQKDKSEKSEDITKRASDDELSSLPNVHKASLSKSRQHSEESRESSDSPKMGASHSKLSLLQDSPLRTHDTLSRLSLLQDSPPNNGISLLQDTPPQQRKLSKEESGTTDSQDSKKTFDKQKTESQDSHDSEASTKRQDSQDSDKSPRSISKSPRPTSKSPRPKLSFIESTKGKLKKSTSDSQDSEDGQFSKQKSDSQDSNESEKSKNKKVFEPRDSKLTRRESLGGQSTHDLVHKWGQKPSPLTKSKVSQKGSKSLDVNPSS